MLDSVPLYLEGAAFEAHSGIPAQDRATWATLRAAMNVALGIGENAPQWKLQFQSTHRKATETIDIFVRKLKQLVARGFPDLQVADDILAKVNEQFIMGNSKELRFHLLTMEGARTLAQNVATAKRYEMADTISKAHGTAHFAEAVIPDPDEETELPQEEAVTTHMAAERVAPRPAPPRRGPNTPPVSTCFRCGQAGHMARECAARARPVAPPASWRCYNCGQMGHISRFCPKKAPERPDPAVARIAQANTGRVMGPMTTCQKCGNLNHTAARCYTDLSKTCHRCDKKGHLAAECRGGRVPVNFSNVLLTQTPKNEPTLAPEEEGGS